MRTIIINWNSKLTMMHELIDREDPRCLYCHSECDFNLSDFGGSMAVVSRTQAEILDCRSCKERFIIHSRDDNGETKYTAFFFTCKKFLVAVHYHTNEFSIHMMKAKMIGEVPVQVPAFSVNFSDKKALHKKLKTYVTFS